MPELEYENAYFVLIAVIVVYLVVAFSLLMMRTKIASFDAT